MEAGLTAQRASFLSFASYGPVTVLGLSGGLAALPPYCVFAIISDMLNTDFALEHIFGSESGLAAVPIWIFLILGVALAFSLRGSRLLWPRPHWWQAIWQPVLGIGLFTALIFYTALPILPELSFWSGLYYVVNMSVGGFLGYALWLTMFTEFMLLAGDLLWEEKSRSLVRFYSRIIGIAKARLLGVKIDGYKRSLEIEGRFTPEEGVRLHSGLLALVDQLDHLELQYGGSGGRQRTKQYQHFAQVTKSIRANALAQAEKQHSGPQGQNESLLLTRFERAMQSRRFGILAGGSVALIVVIVVLSLWVISRFGSLGPVSLGEYLEPFFKGMYERTIIPTDAQGN